MSFLSMDSMLGQVLNHLSTAKRKVGGFMSLIEADSMLRTQCLSKLMDMLFIFRRQVKDYTISSSDTSISSKKAKPIGFLFGIYHLEKVILQCNLPHVLFPPIRVCTLASTRFPVPQGTVAHSVSTLAEQPTSREASMRPLARFYAGCSALFRGLTRSCFYLWPSAREPTEMRCGCQGTRDTFSYRA